jgi:hypothetical protein
MAFELFPLSTSTAVAAISIALYIAYLAIDRLFLSPVSKFPGPKLAALTFWYALDSRGGLKTTGH